MEGEGCPNGSQTARWLKSAGEYFRSNRKCNPRLTHVATLLKLDLLSVLVYHVPSTARVTLFINSAQYPVSDRPSLD